MDSRRIAQSLFVTGTVDPSAVAVAGFKGSLYLGTDAVAGRVWQKTDDGLSTNWTELGAGGGGSSGIPAGVELFRVNLTLFNQFSYLGLMTESMDTSTRANPAGAFNGSGQGNRCFIGFKNYDNMLLSDLDSIEFEVGNFDDRVNALEANAGMVFMNVIVDFQTGDTGVLGSYEPNKAILALDGTPFNAVGPNAQAGLGSFQIGKFRTNTFKGTTAIGSDIITAVSEINSGADNTKIVIGQRITGAGIPANTFIIAKPTVNSFQISQMATANGVDTLLSFSHTRYRIDRNTLGIKCVGGATPFSISGIFTAGSNVITGVSAANIAKITIGNYINGNIGVAPYNIYFPIGTKIIAVDAGLGTVTTDQNAIYTVGVSTSIYVYGGMAPVSRAGISSGTATITGITNTADLNVGMRVDDGGVLVPADSFIVSMVANTSITLNKNVAAGNPTLNFKAMGKSGIPTNLTPVPAVSLNDILANNPSARIINSCPTNGQTSGGFPTINGGWMTNDGGAPRNTLMPGILIANNQSSTNLIVRNAYKMVKINSDVYSFGL